MSNFSPAKYFDLKNFEFKELFEGVDFVWEAIPRISNFIEQKTKKKKIIIGKNTIIHKTAVIQGSAIIGENCYIGPHTFIRENCIIANNCHIGHGVEIKNSILLPGAIPAHLNYIGDSIIGSNVNFAGGSIAANFRLDRKNVTVKDGKKIIDTGLLKFGAIVGDKSVIGVNSVLNPGTILGKNTIIYPLTSVTGVHNEGETIRQR